MIEQILVLIGVLVVCILVKVPVFLSLILSVMAYMVCFPSSIHIEVLAQGLVQGLGSYSLAGVMFFFLAGEIMGKGGISHRLIRFFRAAVGHIRGGLSHANVLESMVFAGVSGSALADTAATCSIMVPAMKENGYSPEYATAITVASSTIGPIIPPSTGLILMGLYTGTNVLRLLMGGLVPGIGMGIFMLAASYLISKKRNYPKDSWKGWGNLAKEFRENFFALLMPVMIIVCLSAGFGTVNEVGAVCCVYAVVVSCFIYKDINLKQLWEAVRGAAKTGGKLLCIIGSAGIFTWIIGSMGLRSALKTVLAPLIPHPVLLLFLCIAIMLIAGMFLDHTIIMLVIAPLMAPAVAAAGIDLVQFCVITMIVATLGLITPPVGMLIYIGSSIGEVNPIKVIRELYPFIIAIMALVILLVFFPQLTVWLPNLLYGRA
ncbi:MAG: TRAP transporter large permease [Lachnospiraceae bacterium]|nr:TRAP transporter large permease [Lachnospiraceae bacterium]